jgi:hypothetical protein
LEIWPDGVTARKSGARWLRTDKDGDAWWIATTDEGAAEGDVNDVLVDQIGTFSFSGMRWTTGKISTMQVRELGDFTALISAIICFIAA